jgi:hypothetical protein
MEEPRRARGRCSGSGDRSKGGSRGRKGPSGHRDRGEPSRGTHWEQLGGSRGEERHRPAGRGERKRVGFVTMAHRFRPDMAEPTKLLAEVEDEPILSPGPVYPKRLRFRGFSRYRMQFEREIRRENAVRKPHTDGYAPSPTTARNTAHNLLMGSHPDWVDRFITDRPPPLPVPTRIPLPTPTLVPARAPPEDPDV